MLSTAEEDVSRPIPSANRSNSMVYSSGKGSSTNGIYMILYPGLNSNQLPSALLSFTISPDPLVFHLLGKSPIKSCRSEEHTSELQSRENLVCRLLLEKKKNE